LIKSALSKRFAARQHLDVSGLNYAVSMSIAEKIFIKAQALPADAQNALLQIVELLAQNPVAEDEEWSRFSLSRAMNGLEEETWPDYTGAPNFQKWQ